MTSRLLTNACGIWKIATEIEGLEENEGWWVAGHKPRGYSVAESVY